MTGNSLALASLGADAGISSLNVADIPSDVRDGDANTRRAYVEGLSFEKVLVGELTEQLASSISGSTSGSDPASGAGATGAGGGLSGSSSAAFSGLVDQALSSAIMDDGGLGIADELSRSLSERAT